MNDRTAVMIHRIDVLIKLAGSFVAATGMVAILGWIFDIPSFKSILPGLVTMKTNTAIAFILSGISLYSVIDGRDKSRARTISQCAALFVLSIGSLTLSEYLFGIDIGIDQLFCREAAGAFGTLSPNRMAPTTAVNFTLIGTALFLLNRRKHIIIANILSVVTTVLGLITLIGYVYGVREFYGIGKYTQMALHTAVAFFFLGAGAMIAAPEKGIGSIITDGSAGGFFARRLLPTSILLPFVIGYFRVQGERAGLFGSYFGVAIVATIYIVAFGIAVLWSAGLVARSEAMKKLADNSAREAEERYKALYESSRDAIMTLEPYGRFLGGNRAAIQLFGCKDEKEFTADVVQMVAVGEETGNIDGMLNKIADFYDMTVNYAVKKLTTIIEPVFLVIMGIIVGTIMASMLLPIFDMVKTMRR